MVDAISCLVTTGVGFVFGVMVASWWSKRKSAAIALEIQQAAIAARELQNIINQRGRGDG